MWFSERIRENKLLKRGKKMPIGQKPLKSCGNRIWHCLKVNFVVTHCIFFPNTHACNISTRGRKTSCNSHYYCPYASELSMLREQFSWTWLNRVDLLTQYFSIYHLFMQGITYNYHYLIYLFIIKMCPLWTRFNKGCKVK